MGKVWFVGAGPGDPDLITIKGRALVEQAGAVLYAGSLVAKAALDWAKPDAVTADSKGMTLEEIADWLALQANRCETVVRLQTGDPSLFGALIEMVRPLDQLGIEVGVVPGVSSAFASAAAGVESLTLPEVTQTVILTRFAGRTPMPQGEDLESLAKHHCSLCIFLSITLFDQVEAALLKAGWDEWSPIMVVEKASWPGEERVFKAPLNQMAALIETNGIKAQAMIVASPTLGARDWDEITKSKLYDPEFTHRFRKAAR